MVFLFLVKGAEEQHSILAIEVDYLLQLLRVALAREIRMLNIVV
jgi:hypothetical protein